ncbi:hypothetical protein [Merismopedia glauca]|uniref:Uncharacterized protein n=1 Tax=Merismopedia glauca CCAP 1448/3 TaxID=1296344 RepID=A0A2T1C524_9CYAN|nr:hypothetical protein [Merismopedia glauca]PSB03385.1 hypothetical protein C7B64_08585 [Merismopedia glauca CCAP 1448/3]
MSETAVQVIITLSDPQLKDEEMQEAIQNLQLEAKEVDGVEEAELISLEQAPPNSKSLGGFLLNQFKALVEIKKLPNLIKTLGSRLFGNQIIKVKAEKNGNKLEIEISNPEDLAKVMPEINKFIDNTKSI